MKMSAFAVVFQHGIKLQSFKAETRDEAEQLVRSLVPQMDRESMVGVYELRAEAVVETSVRFEGMPAASSS